MTSKDDLYQIIRHIPMTHLTISDRVLFRVIPFRTGCGDLFLAMGDIYKALQYPGDVYFFEDEFEERPVPILEGTNGLPDRIPYYPTQILFFRSEFPSSELSAPSAVASSLPHSQRDLLIQESDSTGPHYVRETGNPCAASPPVHPQTLQDRNIPPPPPASAAMPNFGTTNAPQPQIQLPDPAALQFLINSVQDFKTSVLSRMDHMGQLITLLQGQVQDLQQRNQSFQGQSSSRRQSAPAPTTANPPPPAPLDQNQNPTAGSSSPPAAPVAAAVAGSPSASPSYHQSASPDGGRSPPMARLGWYTRSITNSAVAVATNAGLDVVPHAPHGQITTSQTVSHYLERQETLYEHGPTPVQVTHVTTSYPELFGPPGQSQHGGAGVSGHEDDGAPGPSGNQQDYAGVGSPADQHAGSPSGHHVGSPSGQHAHPGSGFPRRHPTGSSPGQQAISRVRAPAKHLIASRAGSPTDEVESHGATQGPTLGTSPTPPPQALSPSPAAQPDTASPSPTVAATAGPSSGLLYSDEDPHPTAEQIAAAKASFPGWFHPTPANPAEPTTDAAVEEVVVQVNRDNTDTQDQPGEGVETTNDQEPHHHHQQQQQQEPVEQPLCEEAPEEEVPFFLRDKPNPYLDSLRDHRVFHWVQRVEEGSEDDQEPRQGAVNRHAGGAGSSGSAIKEKEKGGEEEEHEELVAHRQRSNESKRSRDGGDDRDDSERSSKKSTKEP
ncbi:hypothetical protein BGX23_002048 [Mortierella sp. AD031]|nr:hypothetical protein BGX23_002048 [Mortierella sp. AD031]